MLLGALNVWLIFQASKTLKTSPMNERLIRAHRLGGYFFIAIFCVMSYFMFLRTRGVSDDLSTRALVHILIAMSLAPLLFVKVLIARYYKSFYSALTTLGVIIFCLAFVLVALAAAPYFLRAAPTRDVPASQASASTQIDLPSAEKLMQKKCSRCHALDRVIGARKNAEGWSATISRMRALPGSHISDDDATTILNYLVKADSIDSSTLQGQLRVGKALVDSHCGRCHQLDRVYRSAFSAEQWRDTVTRMVSYASGTDGFFKPGEDRRIIDFLSKTQTPESIAARRDQSSSSVLSDSTPTTSPIKKATESPGRPDRAGIETAVVLSLITIVFGTLLIRRPNSTAPALRAGEAARIPDKAAPPIQNPIVLQLVRVERQTHNCVTLRFRLPKNVRLAARPGQFLSFTWLLNGEKVFRSYTISSSPTQTGYIEITPKRAADGFVSAFLNDTAAIGLTVEATGPAGQFYFDEHAHKSIVLVAAGSGITPMISMLRFIDDCCLDTDVTLLYAARTELDIIFEAEIARLGRSLRSFRYLAVLSRPKTGWTGLSGRITQNMLSDVVNKRKDASFFLCGPDAFMADVTAALKQLGISGEQIRRENFGGPKIDLPSCAGQASAGTVEFTRSQTKCEIIPGLTLLETAEKNGVAIPYGCRQGQCGTCATKLLEGEVNMAAEAGLTSQLKEAGFVLPCVSRAQGDIRLEV